MRIRLSDNQLRATVRVMRVIAVLLAVWMISIAWFGETKSAMPLVVIVLLLVTVSSMIDPDVKAQRAGTKK